MNMDDTNFGNESLIAKIQEAFDEYIKENGKEPNVADSQITWQDDENTCDVNIQLSVDSNPETDDRIFFYCDGLNDLKSLTTPGGEDFIVTDFYHFE